nr:HAD-IA family hydrolase [Pseudoclavibacter chungangensis]
MFAAQGVLFDLDGVLTPTAEVHMRAWQRLFDDEFAARGIESPYTDRDYFDHVDGKKRYDGVAALLADRGVELPWGEPGDPPSAETVCGIGNRKNVLFERLLEEGIEAYPGSVRLLDELARRDVPVAVVSSSKNAERVLRVAGLSERFPVVVDGVVAEIEGLPSKPAPDVFLAGAERLHVEPARSAAVEDALSGVASAVAGGFGLVIGVDRGTGAQALLDAGAHLVVTDLGELLD